MDADISLFIALCNFYLFRVGTESVPTLPSYPLFVAG